MPDPKWYIGGTIHLVDTVDDEPVFAKTEDEARAKFLQEMKNLERYEGFTVNEVCIDDVRLIEPKKPPKPAPRLSIEALRVVFDLASGMELNEDEDGADKETADKQREALDEVHEYLEIIR